MDFGKIARNLGDAAGKVAEKAASAAGSAAASAKEGIESIDVKNVQKKVASAAGSATAAFKDVAGKGANAMGEASSAAASALQKAQKPEDEPDVQEPCILAVGAVRSLCYLMAADGEISSEEKEWLDSMGESLVTEYADLRDEIKEHCEQALKELDSTDNRVEAVANLVEKEISDSSPADGQTIYPYLFVWNMFVMANRDGSCCEAERIVINRAVDLLALDHARVAELECAVVTLREIESEIESLKASRRPYSEIAPIVDELETRMSVVLGGAQDLIAL